MKLSIGDRVKYHSPENSYPKPRYAGKDFRGIVTHVTHYADHDRATVKIDANTDHLLEIECNQRFLDPVNN